MSQSARHSPAALAKYEWATARSLAIVTAYNSANPFSPAQFVTADRRLHRIDAWDFVQSSYGAAWGAFVSGGSRELTELSRRTADYVESVTLPPPEATESVAADIADSMERFWGLVGPFHHALADHLDEQRRDLADAFARWLDDLSAGGVAFGRLVQAVNDPVAESPE